MDDLTDMLYDNFVSKNDPSSAVKFVFIKRELDGLTKDRIKEDAVTSEDMPSTSNAGNGIDKILQLPEPCQRKTNKHFKRPNCGILTKDSVIEQYEKIENEKQEAEQQKVKRREIRENRKKIKEERNKTEDKPKRGRPRKN